MVAVGKEGIINEVTKFLERYENPEIQAFNVYIKREDIGYKTPAEITFRWAYEAQEPESPE